MSRKPKSELKWNLKGGNLLPPRKRVGEESGELSRGRCLENVKKKPGRVVTKGRGEEENADKGVTGKGGSCKDILIREKKADHLADPLIWGKKAEKSLKKKWGCWPEGLHGARQERSETTALCSSEHEPHAKVEEERSERQTHEPRRR